MSSFNKSISNSLSSRTCQQAARLRQAQSAFVSEPRLRLFDIFLKNNSTFSYLFKTRNSGELRVSLRWRLFAQNAKTGLFRVPPFGFIVLRRFRYSQPAQNNASGALTIPCAARSHECTQASLALSATFNLCRNLQILLNKKITVIKIYAHGNKRKTAF